VVALRLQLGGEAQQRGHRRHEHRGGLAARPGPDEPPDRLRDAPHWIIQEIGTGKRATIQRHDTPNPVGRPRKGASHVRTVKSQRGRRISAGLVFASGGNYSAPGARTGENLHWASRVQGVPMRTRQNPRGQNAAIRISKEIQGQHFVKKGGQAGFREYRGSVLAAARQAFRKAK
jgi:hypothetical protein